MANEVINLIGGRIIMKKYKLRHLIAAFLFGSLLFSSVTLAMVNPKKDRADQYVDKLVEVTFINEKAETIGKGYLSEVKDGVRLQVMVANLSPGKHGFHVHEKSFTGTDFASAGPHFNPDGKKHGFNNPEGYHLGDMYNLMVTQEGRANMEFFIEHANLKKGDRHSLLGRSFMIHAGEDDFVTDPAGNSGDRIAGANIPQ